MSLGHLLTGWRQEKLGCPNQDQDVLPPLPGVHQIHPCYGICLHQCVGFKTYSKRVQESGLRTSGLYPDGLFLTLAELPLKAVSSPVAESPTF